MPLIIICGFPSSGKTSRAVELYNYFKAKSVNVHLFSENTVIKSSNYDKNEFFSNSNFEKMVRSNLKSKVLADLNTKDLVILDAGNYIKGYRYELYCSSKLVTTTQCTLFCSCSKETAAKFNKERSKNFDDILGDNNSDVPYEGDVFEGLCQRFEEPNENCRWDKPLYVCYPDEELNIENIDDALFKGKKLSPNLSTQNLPLSTGNFLFKLDKQTQDIVKQISDSKKLGLQTCTIEGISFEISSNMDSIRLNKLRRQFTNLYKLDRTNDLNETAKLFIRFVISSSNGE
ncbi:KTI12 family protein [Megaselia abdita]